MTVFLSLMLSIITIPSMANPVTLEKAMQTARHFAATGMRKARDNRNISLAYIQKQKIADTDSVPMLYVFNINKEGHVIISADDVAESVLAYCENNPFDADNLPPNVKNWIDGYAQEIAWAKTHETGRAERSEAPRKAPKTISPLIKTKWNQTEPFNDQCIFNDKRCYTGCVPTAMAQIMYFWATTGKDGTKFKKGSTALPAYTTATKKYSVPKKGALDTFSWADMTKETPTTTAGKKAVATLMRYCGQSVKVDYTDTDKGSGASMEDAFYALKNNFAYNLDIELVSSDGMTKSEWKDLIYNELAAGRPVIMSGNNDNSKNFQAHAFICHGYDSSNSHFYFNWGWGGQYDGYYKMSALTPSDQDYSYNKDAIINIQPTLPSDYALLSSDSKTLTFYRDNKRLSREGNWYEISPDWETDEMGWTNKTAITKVVFASSFADARPTSTYRWFDGLKNLTTISNIQNLNMSKVEDTDYMFYGCTSLKSLDVSSFNMASLISSYEMFGDCTGLNSIKISSSMNKLKGDAFTGVGKSNAPCIISAPNGFDYGTDTARPLFKWKSGYFYKQGAKVAYAYNTYGKLVFCCDDACWTHGTTPFSMNTGTGLAAWRPIAASFNIVEFSSSFANARPTSTYGWFYGMENLTTINGLNNLNTSEVTNMTGMFLKCKKLTSLDLSGFKTDKVTHMANMFMECEELVSINLGGFSTKNAENLGNMFLGCHKLQEIDLSGFDTSKAQNMKSMFYNCKSLTSLDASNLEINDEAETGQMFYGCSGMKEIWISQSMGGLQSDAFGGIGSSSEPCTMHAPDGFDFSTNTSGDFFYWKEGYFTFPRKTYALLKDNNLSFFCDGSSTYKEGTIFEVNTNMTLPEWSSLKESVNTVTFDPSFSQAKPTKTDYWFNGMTALTHIEGLEYLNTSEVTSMVGMFKKCCNLKQLDLSHFNTTNVTDMQQMFQECSFIEKLDLTSFDTRKVTNMKYMFYQCKRLKSLNISNFDTHNVTGMECLFYDCNNLKNLDVSSLSTEKVTSMYFMFGNCFSLEELDLSSFNTSNVNNMYCMFSHCSNLRNMDIGNFNMDNVEDNGYMFFLCEKLQHVKLPSNLRNIDHYMFRSCYDLQEIHIPESITSIGEYAFDGCNSLMSVKVGFPVPVSISENVFSNRNNATLFVPDNSRNAFIAAPYWRDFRFIIEDGNGTGIQTANSSKKDGSRYGINGIKISENPQNPPYYQQGIIIINGKKYISK